jgi:serine/threonine-protein kinase RsbW
MRVRERASKRAKPPKDRSLRFHLADPEDPASAAAGIDGIEDKAVRIARAGGLSDDNARFLGVALREAIVNALCHGRQADGHCEVEVHVRKLFGRVLSMMVRDRGPGFDPASVADPCLPENAGKSGGRGIFFMRQFADRVKFDFPPDGGVVVRLAKRLPGRKRG